MKHANGTRVGLISNTLVGAEIPSSSSSSCGVTASASPYDASVGEWVGESSQHSTWNKREMAKKKGTQNCHFSFAFYARQKMKNGNRRKKREAAEKNV
ncbi:Hypothetical predicted protein [Drosophila guanche]|uniref:Uncharacterized protein n=1 Tax=Drosophila guanche TaxID=7266 RepID=A0A3B0K6J7_DROGU|nr:Hypothetical predicted protein [Drosophila guanche]